MVEIVERGIDNTYFFFDPSLSEPLKYRAITRSEHEEIKAEAMRIIDNPRIAKILIDWLLDREIEEEEEDLSVESYLELRKYYFEVALLTCYNGTKDFQPDNYTLDMLRSSFVDVMDLCVQILEKSMAKRKEVVEMLQTVDGTNLATIVYRLNVPITDAVWKLTPVQLLFLVEGHKYIYGTPQQSSDKGETKITQEDMLNNPELTKARLMALFK